MCTEFRAGGFKITIHDNGDGSGVIDRFVGYPGEYRACEFGPGKPFATAEEWLEAFCEEEAEIAAAERRCPQM